MARDIEKRALSPLDNLDYTLERIERKRELSETQKGQASERSSQEKAIRDAEKRRADAVKKIRKETES